MMPPEETRGLVAASDEGVHHVRHSPPPSSVIIGHHRDHKRKRTNHSVGNDDAVPQEQLTAAWSTVDADRGATDQPAMPTGGAHRSQRRAPAAERLDTGGSSSRDDKASPSVVPPPASSKAIRVKHSSSPSFIIGGSSGKQHPAGSGSSPGGGSHSYYANSHAAAAPSSSSKRLTIRGPAAPPPPPPPPPLHLPAKARRPRSASAAPSAAVPLEPNDDECFRQGVKVFGEWDVATQQAAVNRFVSQPPPLPEGRGFSFWLTPDEADADLKYVHEMVEEARRTSTAASGSGKPSRRH